MRKVLLVAAFVSVTVAAAPATAETRCVTFHAQGGTAPYFGSILAIMGVDWFLNYVIDQPAPACPLPAG